MAYTYLASSAEAAWLDGLLSLADGLADRYSLDVDTTAVAVGVGRQDRESRAYKRGYRGPASAEGQTALELLRSSVWGVRAGCGPWEPAVRQAAARTGRRVFAALDLPVGVCQVVGMDDKHLRYTVYATATLPSLFEWCEDPALCNLTRDEAAAVMSEIAEAHRVDALTPLIPAARQALVSS